jgi:[acyl-carrier-protein] S-malonyltransferase
MKEPVFLFDGQGAFRPGVGKELYQKYPRAKEIVELSSEILGYDLIDYLWGQKSQETAGQTSIAQPAISAVSLAYAEVLRDHGLQGVVSLGHSLGEATAIIYCGVVSTEDGIRMIKKRGEVMEAGGKQGTMMAVLNIERKKLEEICSAVAKSSEPVVVANINAPNQIVISGSEHGVRDVAKRVLEHGGRGIPLNVGGAWHSPYLRDAASDFTRFLDNIEFKKPRTGFYSVVRQKMLESPKEIRDSMKDQMLAQVDWVRAIENLKANGHSLFLEIGPSKILKDLVGKIDAGLMVDSTALHADLGEVL